MTGARAACNLWDHTGLRGRKTIPSIQSIKTGLQGALADRGDGQGSAVATVPEGKMATLYCRCSTMRCSDWWSDSSLLVIAPMPPNVHTFSRVRFTQRDLQVRQRRIRADNPNWRDYNECVDMEKGNCWIPRLLPPIRQDSSCSLIHYWFIVYWSHIVCPQKSLPKNRLCNKHC